MHNYWFKKMNIIGNYKAIETSIKEFKKTIKRLHKDGYTGLNLTIPLKEEALKYLHKKDKIVDIVGAVNVLNFSKKGNIEGKNTDVYGFKKSLEGLIKSKNKKSAVIIGSGGSTRAVLYSLIEMKYRKIFIFNRTKKKADQIKEDFIKKLKKSLKSEIYSDNLKNINSELEKTDLLVNTTPLGMKGFPPLKINLKKLKKSSIIFDLIYNPLETNLLKNAKKLGLKNTNGLDMLIYQAQKSFLSWTKKEPKKDIKLKKILEREIK